MSMPDCPKGIEPTELLAFSAWFAFHCIPIRKWDEHPLLRVLPWNQEHCAVLDDFAERDLNPEDFDTLDMASPREARTLFESLPQGAHKMAFRLLFFELAISPNAAQPKAILDVLCETLNDKELVLPDVLLRSGQMGPFVFGPGGLIIRACSSQASVVALREGGYSSALSKLADAIGFSGGSAPNAPVFHPSPSWGEQQLRLFEGQRLLCPEHLKTRAEMFFYYGFRRRWMPRGPSSSDFEDSFAAVLSSISDVQLLSQLVRRCLEVDRKPFYAETSNWRYAERARAALEQVSNGGATLPLVDSRQLLLLARPETVLRCINERKAAQGVGYLLEPLAIRDGRLVPAWTAKVCFAVNLARALEAAYEKTGNLPQLDFLTCFSRGDRFHRTLHYVLRQSPADILRAQLTQPAIASALAAMTYCHSMFAEPGSWDASDPALQEQLFREVANGLGFAKPPETLAKTRPYDRRDLRRLLNNGNADALQNLANQVRRHAEWIFKTVIQWAYATWSTLEPNKASKGNSLAHEEDICVVGPFFSSEQFSKRVEEKGLLFGGKPLAMKADGKLTLGELHTLLCSIDSLLPYKDKAAMKPMFEEHNELRRLYSDFQVASVGNLGSHDNPVSIAELKQGVQSLVDFDLAARALKDAFPQFMVFEEEIIQPNHPRQVRFARLIDEEQDDLNSHAELSFFFTHGRRFKGERIYAALDVTRNSLSLDPVVVDWTDWVVGES